MVFMMTLISKVEKLRMSAVSGKNVQLYALAQPVLLKYRRMTRRAFFLFIFQSV